MRANQVSLDSHRTGSTELFATRPDNESKIKREIIFISEDAVICSVPQLTGWTTCHWSTSDPVSLIKFNTDTLHVSVSSQTRYSCTKLTKNPRLQFINVIILAKTLKPKKNCQSGINIRDDLFFKLNYQTLVGSSFLNVRICSIFFVILIVN